MKKVWEYSLETGEVFYNHERGREVVIEADGASPDDSRHIVKCVNAHDQLVSSLRAMLETTYHLGGCPGTREDALQILKNLGVGDDT